MRNFALGALLLAAACSDGGADQAARQKATAEAAKKLQLTPGQWETVVEVTRLTQQDKAAKPAIDTPAGSKSTVRTCVTPADVRNPPAVLLAGNDAYICKADNLYMSGGTLNTQLTCTRKGLAGKIGMSIDGSYTADTITANQSLSTFLTNEGDANIVSTIAARRVGDCPA